MKKKVLCRKYLRSGRAKKMEKSIWSLIKIWNFTGVPLFFYCVKRFQVFVVLEEILQEIVENLNYLVLIDFLNFGNLLEF